MTIARVNSDRTLDVTVSLGRLQYLSAGVAPPTHAAPDAGRAARDPQHSVQHPQAVMSMGAARNGLPRLPRMPRLRGWHVPALSALVASAFVGTGVWLWTSHQTSESARSLPVPIADTEVSPGPLIEQVQAPFRVAQAASAALPVMEGDAAVEMHPPIGLPIPAAPKSSSPPVRLQPATPAPPPAGAAKGQAVKAAAGKDAGGGAGTAEQPQTHVVVDDAPAPAVSAAARAASSAPTTPAAQPATRSGAAVVAAPGTAIPPKATAKGLLAVPTADWVVVTDPATNLPQKVPVGGKLPNGAKVLSANPGTGVVTTDQGILKLE